jgi:hypothetical protein
VLNVFNLVRGCNVTACCASADKLGNGSHFIFRQMLCVFMQHSEMCKTEIIDANQATSIKTVLLICSANMLGGVLSLFVTVCRIQSIFYSK